MKTKAIGYWTATAILVFAVLTGGMGELARAWGPSIRCGFLAIRRTS
jgi:hypothetical protein